jgi:hypothetical protein
MKSAAVKQAIVLVMGIATVVTLTMATTKARAACVEPNEAGEWKNVASQNAAIHKIALRFICQDQVVNGQLYPPGPPWRMRVWGKCESTSCDWGEVAAKPLADGSVYAVYSRAGVARHVWAKPSRHRPGQLWVYTRIDSKDSNSGDNGSQDWFLREGR